MTEERAPIAITGLGATSSLGRGVDAIARALAEGRDGLASVTHFDAAVFAPVHLGGCVPGGGSALSWAVEAALEAWRDAELDHVTSPRERVAVVVGTGEGERDEAGSSASDMNAIAAAVARAVGAKGPAWTVSSACSSSTNAIGLGRDLIERGDADIVLAGGAERLAMETYAGFCRLGVLSVEPCSPFGETRGTTLGEGAAFVVLERDGRRRPWAYLNGYGLAGDAWHPTTPEPRGGGLARAMRGALSDAGLDAGDIDYVNAHGTGTAANDDAEWRGVQQVFGPGAQALPISGSKGILGHGQGAAGALELVTTLICLREGTIPPGLRVGAGRANGPPDPVAGDRPRAHSVEHLLSNSSAFGGANAVLCVGRSPSIVSARRREVRVVGLGTALTEAGAERDEAALARAVEADLRGTDPSGQLALAACSRALTDAGVTVRGGLRDRAGIVAAATRISCRSEADYRQSAERGFDRVSAPAFARLVLHAPAGDVSRSLSLRGPTTTLATAGTGGLLAFIYAADLLERRDDADILLACGVDERPDRDTLEGAACAVLRACDDHGTPRVAGAASAGPGSVDAAVEVALGRAGLTRADVERWIRAERPCAEAPSFRGMMLALEAARAVRDGAEVVVALADSRHVSCAVVLTSSAHQELSKEGISWTS